MGSRRVVPLIAAAVLLSGCVPRVNGQGGSGISLALGGKGSPPPVTVKSVQRELSAAEKRVRELEDQLAARDREIAAVRGQMQAVQEGRQPAGAAADSPAPAAPVAPPAPPPAAAPLPAPAPAPVAAAPAPAAGTGDESRLAAAQEQIAVLQARLDSEVQRRKEVEAEMARLLQETSAGPYERADDAVGRHLQQELDGARQEIAELRTTLATERRQRADLEKRFSALQTQVQRTSGAGGSEEIEALKERQRRVLASIQQDLEASRQRERELRESLEQGRGNDAVSLADAVSGLRAENSALQRRLDDEHRRNRELQAKLQTATRVTDLIFKMQSSGATTATVAP